ncbi:hypothetical protein AWJ20_1210 [Sugiyamaella lignohabitans]|uniref:BTB domain-containing protein n=1 Tax=Sugiyamaella lignohabitans TaxID=796027 RepID=A0A167DHN1_9ASCO|nr:uncharacterized protein AWJ20_1210 [Sugiyamaella lignohabitans]ANB12932.1 hypothetical protein AWJ20_1210 [Sugiyamaella lignohabitans]
MDNFVLRDSDIALPISTNLSVDTSSATEDSEFAASLFASSQTLTDDDETRRVADSGVTIDEPSAPGLKTNWDSTSLYRIYPERTEITAKNGDSLDSESGEELSDALPSYDQDSCEKLVSTMNHTPRHRQISNFHGSLSTNRKQMTLNEYLFEQALGQGICSDVTIRAFGTEYNLHKLILYRSPYFASLFSVLWSNDNSKDHKFHTESNGDSTSRSFNSVFDIDFSADPHITREVFELALGYLYRNGEAPKSPDNMFGLFAIASFLDIPDLANDCLDHLIRNIDEGNIAEMASFATSFDYGPPSELISEACKSFLCIEGPTVSEDIWLKIPSDMLVDVITSDSFFVTSEFDRCVFLMGRYNQISSLLSSLEFSDFSSSLNQKLVLDDDIKKGADADVQGTEDVSADRIENLKQTLIRIQKGLNFGIHYANIAPGQLRFLESVKDRKLNPLIDRAVLLEALWTQTMLQQDICSKGAFYPSTLSFISQHGLNYRVTEESVRTDRNQSRLEAEANSGPTLTGYPPFRFAVEFPNVAEMPVYKRVYSQTFWYAGSYWNVYIQRGPHKKGVYQLGVYLHRGRPDMVPDSSQDYVSSSIRRNDGSFSVHGEDQTYDDLTAVYKEKLSPVENQKAFEQFKSSQPRVSMTPSNECSGNILLKVGRELKEVRNAVNMEPLYIDERKKVSAYFKIYTTSREGMSSLSCFSSSPDTFDISQSWGWKSKSLYSSAILSKKPLKFMVTVGII